MSDHNEELKVKDEDTAKLTKGINLIDYKNIKILHKLGSGGFGTVRLAKLRVATDHSKVGEPSTQEDTDSGTDSPLSKPAASEETKVSQFNLARKKSGIKEEKEDSWKYVAVKLISKYKVLTTR